MTTSSRAETARLAMATDAGKHFSRHFTDATAPRLFYSPGRVNLIGDHTDYNGGLVFPCAVSSGIALAIAPRSDGKLRLRSANFDFTLELDNLNNLQAQDKQWVNYPLGVLKEFLNSGAKLSGYDCFYSGDVPDGAGVSSSAAIEVVTAFAINELAGLKIKIIELAKLCQRAENEFVGVSCGIMDQFAVAMGKSDHAMALDCNTLRYEYVPIKLDNTCFVLANTNQKRDMAAAGYNERVKECARAIELLQPKHPVEKLAELQPDALVSCANLFAEDIIAYQRATHVVAENQRVRLAMAALRGNDMVAFGHLMNGSHNSLRDLYEVSSEPLEHLVSAALETKGTLGTRLTGAGFGGCTVSLVESSEVEQWIEQVGKSYAKRSGREADFYIFDVAAGVGEITDGLVG